MTRSWNSGSFQLLGLILFGLVLLEVPTATQAARRPEGENLRIHEALEVLVHVPAGRDLVKLAKVRGLVRSETEISRIFKWGEASRTDAVLTRHFDPATGQEERERKVTIYLRKDQPLQDLVLDIAHELTHAVAGPTWDPYDPSLTAGKYIWVALEGEGGEVDALVAECQVGLELSMNYGVSAARCQRYRESRKASERLVIDREKVERDFYRVGSWKRELAERLGAEADRFPMLSGDAPKLFSSTGHAPYPVALLKEFEEISVIACENSRKRLKTLGRAPASVNDLTHFIKMRCR